MASSGSQAHSRRLPSTTPPEAPQLLAKVRKLSLFGGKATRLLAGAAVVALLASAALGWRLEAAFGVVVVVQRVGRVGELACP
ncbi:MAG TPA: hypothetical protein DEV93_22290, partial [Chloroflexi bacterium]|nr:hypothetical protein [Chloroflexota bacterium]